MSKPRFKAKRVGFFLVPLLALCVYLVVSTRPRIPELPRLDLSEPVESKGLSALEQRTKSVELKDNEKEMVDLLTRLNLEEIKRQRGDSNDTAQLGAEVTRVATALAAADESRYLLVGDWLAYRFYRSFLSLLTGTPIVSGAEKSEEFKEVHRLGGTFYSRFVKVGAIDRQGVWRVSKLAVPVLFRVRWRNLAGLPIRMALSAVEQKIYFDFIAAFGNHDKPAKRLSAVSMLKKLEPSYDADLAQAVIYHQAGRNKKALKKLEQAVESGRSDRDIANFIKALRQ